ncbi:MAG: hypothetical protein QOH05_4138 [Acetobacteraceae bacterium]|jgi:hypothetical protein|nr:hypothetical protein [Acetobacteraceae bacterium]
MAQIFWLIIILAVGAAGSIIMTQTALSAGVEMSCL